MELRHPWNWRLKYLQDSLFRLWSILAASLTRLTNAFSKKLENHAAMVALYFMYYNFGRVHQTLRVPPAMEAGIASHVWSVDEIVELLNRP